MLGLLARQELKVTPEQQELLESKVKLDFEELKVNEVLLDLMELLQLKVKLVHQALQEHQELRETEV